jgi:o-succinylbenzoate synthase
MHLLASFRNYTLQFLRPAGTSRGVYYTKESWFIVLSDGVKTGIGECSLLKGLSIDDRPDYKKRLEEICDQINQETFDFDQLLYEFPSIKFGLETALLDLINGGSHIIFPSKFSEGKSGITTNGLIWMGDKRFMKQQITEKLEKGFSCLKLKIGVNWEMEKEIISELRHQFPIYELTIRVDANGAYSPQQASKILPELADLKVHSIEQPIKAGNWDEMANLCSTAPLPVALDEELIGIFPKENKKELLQTINPQYLILKPSLLGGFKASEEWIALAGDMNIGWWATSALESNIGLNAIAQWVFTNNVTIPQGLGTGMLFSNNISSPLIVRGEKLFYDESKNWGEIVK